MELLFFNKIHVTFCWRSVELYDLLPLFVGICFKRPSALSKCTHYISYLWGLPFAEAARYNLINRNEIALPKMKV